MEGKTQMRGVEEGQAGRQRGREGGGRREEEGRKEGAVKAEL